jgi:UDP-glucose:O-linked fucose beta-1,3-glucosyltransferase
VFQLALDLNERQQRVKTLPLKYETIASRMQNSVDGEHSKAYFIIAAAQDKDELQREGDALNAKLKKSAKELLGLEKVDSTFCPSIQYDHCGPS